MWSLLLYPIVEVSTDNQLKLGFVCFSKEDQKYLRSTGWRQNREQPFILSRLDWFT